MTILDRARRGLRREPPVEMAYEDSNDTFSDLDECANALERNEQRIQETLRRARSQAKHRD